MTKPKEKVLKICRHCSAEFMKAGQNHFYCSKACQADSKVEYNKEYAKTYIRKNPVKRMIASAKTRARRRNLPFDLVDSDVAVPDVCPILGIKMQIYTSGSHGGRPDSYSLDRIHPALGYVKGNVQVISHLANSMKSSATHEQLIMFSKWILANLSAGYAE